MYTYIYIYICILETRHGDTVQAHSSRSFDASCIDMLIVLAVVCKVDRVCQKIDPESLPEPSSEHLKLVPERSRGSPGATSCPKMVPADSLRRLRRVPECFPRQPGAIPKTPAAGSEGPGDASGALGRLFPGAPAQKKRLKSAVVRATCSRCTGKVDFP